MGDSERETTGGNEPTDRANASATARRRSVLRALGGAGALAALGGQSAAREGTSPAREGASATAAGASATEAGTAEDARERARRQGEIDPVWGFPALSDDEEPPVSPDHEVEVQIRPRDAPIPEFVFEPTGLSVESGDTVRFSYASPHHTVTAYHPGFGYVQRVPDGVPPFSAPALPGEAYWLYTFEREGVYDLHCAPHEIFGHAMRIVVDSPGGPGAEPLPDLCAGQGTTGMGETAPGAETTAGDEATGMVDTTAEADTTETADTTATVETTAAVETAAGDETQAGDGNGEAVEGEMEPEPPRLGAYAVLSDPALDPETIVDQGRVSWDDLAPESKQLFVRIEGFPPC